MRAMRLVSPGDRPSSEQWTWPSLLPVTEM